MSLFDIITLKLDKYKNMQKLSGTVKFQTHKTTQHLNKIISKSNWGQFNIHSNENAVFGVFSVFW